MKSPQCVRLRSNDSRNVVASTGTFVALRENGSPGSSQHESPKGSGSIRRRGSCYYAIANAPDPATGRRTQRWSCGCRTKLAGQVELGKLLAAGDQYHPVHGLKLKRLVLDY